MTISQMSFGVAFIPSFVFFLYLLASLFKKGNTGIAIFVKVMLAIMTMILNISIVMVFWNYL